MINYCSSDTPNTWWMLKDITNSMHMIHDKIHEKLEFINKLKITSIHNEIYKWAHTQKFINKITITRIHLIHNQIYEQTNFKKKNAILCQKLIIVHTDTLIHLNSYCVCVFCSILRLCIPAFAYHQVSLHLKPIAGVPFDSVRRFRATLLLHTTCMRFWGNWVASCVAA